MSSKKHSRSVRVLRELKKQNDGRALVLQTSATIPPHATPIGRLRHVWQDFDFDEKIVDKAMRFSKGGLFFCDSTVFLAPTAPLLWDAMTRGNSIALIPSVVQELRPWIDDERPSTNLVAHALVKACLSGHPDCGVQWISKPKQEWIADSVNYYANLLGTRKLFWHIAEHELTNQLGRAPEAQETSNFIQKFGSSRAQLLAAQGRNPRVPAHIYNDEWLVATALVYAITTGTEVTIVSSDEAVLDQFFKITLLLSRHYTATLIAAALSDWPAIFQTEVVANPDVEILKGAEITLVKNLPDSARDFLPRESRTVNVHCMLLQSKVTRCTFGADCGIEQTLRIKHNTDGLSTDRLAGKNFHCVPPRTVRAKHGNVGIIAEDETVDAGGPVPLAHTDIQDALANDDTFSDVKWIDPRVLLLPPHYNG